MGEAGQGMSKTCGKHKEFCLVQLTLPNWLSGSYFPLLCVWIVWKDSQITNCKAGAKSKLHCYKHLARDNCSH